MRKSTVPPLRGLSSRGRTAYNQENVMYVGLGLTKATHEFVMLHYFATDSAQIWDDLDSMDYIGLLTRSYSTSKGLSCPAAVTCGTVVSKAPTPLVDCQHDNTSAAVPWSHALSACLSHGGFGPFVVTSYA